MSDAVNRILSLAHILREGEKNARDEENTVGGKSSQEGAS